MTLHLHRPARRLIPRLALVTGRAFSRAQFGRWAAVIGWVTWPAYCFLLVRQYERLWIVDDHGVVQIIPPGQTARPTDGLLALSGISAAMVASGVTLSLLGLDWIGIVAVTWILIGLGFVWLTTEHDFPGRLRRLPAGLSRQQRVQIRAVARSASEVEMLAADAGRGTRLMMATRAHLLSSSPGEPILVYARTARHAQVYRALLELEQPFDTFGLLVTPGWVTTERG